MNKLRFKKFIAFILAVAIQLSLIPTAVYADNSSEDIEQESAATIEWQKADYIGYVFPYRTTEGDLKQGFINAAVNHVTVTEMDKEQYENQIYGSELLDPALLAGGMFIVGCADEADLLDCRTFARTAECDDQLRFLRDINEFPAYLSSDCTQFGGSEYEVSEGDIIFWLDEEEKAVNAGIVDSLNDGIVHAVVCNAQIGYAELELDSEALEKNDINHFVVVSLEYPCYERIVFFYLINEQKMSIPAACGVMCNLYYESGFDPNREEELNSIGYGICQWSRTRRHILTDWCSLNNRDSKKLYAQLDFLFYELEMYEPELLEYLLSPTADAYNAGYKFCAEYECPDGGESEAQSRGNESVMRFYGAYGGHPYM